MTGGAGFVRDMQNRLKQNSSMLSSNRDSFKSNNRDLVYSKEKSRKIKSKNISKIKLEEIKTTLDQRLVNLVREREFL